MNPIHPSPIHISYCCHPPCDQFLIVPVTVSYIIFDKALALKQWPNLQAYVLQRFLTFVQSTFLIFQDPLVAVLQSYPLKPSVFAFALLLPAGLIRQLHSTRSSKLTLTWRSVIVLCETLSRRPDWEPWRRRRGRSRYFLLRT